MKEDELLKNKHILVVDDEEDVLEYVGEELHMCLFKPVTTRPLLSTSRVTLMTSSFWTSWA